MRRSIAVRILVSNTQKWEEKAVKNIAIGIPGAGYCKSKALKTGISSVFTVEAQTYSGRKTRQRRDSGFHTKT